MKYLILLFVSLSSFSNSLEIEPIFEKVELKEFTSLSLNIMPDTGTQLIFPFTLDNPELTPNLKIKLSNSDGFWVPTTETEIKQLEGQNTLNILGNADSDGSPKHLGILNISVGGYNLTIALKTVYDPRKIKTNIVFNIPDEKREHMVEKSVERYTASIDKEYKDKLNNLEALARKNALNYVGDIVLNEPDVESFKIETESVIDNNRLLIFSDRIESYNDSFFVFIYEVENYSSVDFKVNNFSFFGLKNDLETMYDGKNNCPSLIKSGGKYKCTFTTLDKSAIDLDEYKIILNTDRGEGVFKW
jgi:hypothetical protein